MIDDSSTKDEEDQVADYLEQLMAPREALKPKEKSSNHYHAEAKFRQNKNVQAAATKKLAESRKPIKSHLFKKSAKKKRS